MQTAHRGPPSNVCNIDAEPKADKLYELSGSAHQLIKLRQDSDIVKIKQAGNCWIVMMPMTLKT